MKRNKYKKATVKTLILENAERGIEKTETRQTTNGGVITAPGGHKHAAELAKSYRIGRVISTPVRLIRYHSDAGAVHGLLFVTRKHKKVRVIFIDTGGVRVRTFTRHEMQYMRGIRGSIPKGAARLREAGEKLGISRVAKKLLSGI